MEFESILVSKALPDGTFSQKAVIDTHRTITSSNDLRDFTAGTIRSSRGEFDACVYTRESVCREAASLCAGHAQQLGGVSPSTQPDGGEGLAKRKGYRREAGSGRSVKQTCESMDKNRI